MHGTINPCKMDWNRAVAKVTGEVAVFMDFVFFSFLQRVVWFIHFICSDGLLATD